MIRCIYTWQMAQATIGKDKNRRESKHMCQRDYKEKRFAMTAAKQLGYGDAVIERIRQSNSLYEIDRIMRTARLNMPWR